MSLRDLPDRPLLVDRLTSSSTAGLASSRPKFHSPPVELPSSNAQNFFEEAKIHPGDETELRKKFSKFSRIKPEHPEPVLGLAEFCLLLQHFDICPPHQYESYFYAMDRNHDDLLDFNEFFLGCCAADPATVHILNSFTGYERAQYIFDFFDVNRSATLEFNEFARLTAESLSLQSFNPNDENVRRQAIEKAKELGALEDAGHLLHFTCIKFKKFYDHIHTEKLRGTSRLFRFTKSIIKSTKRRDERRDDGHLECDRLLCEQAQRRVLDDQTAWHNFLLDEFETGEEEAPHRAAPSDGPYLHILPAAPPTTTTGLRGLVAGEVQHAAVTVLDALLIGEKLADDLTDAPKFTLLSPLQIAQLCQAVSRQVQAEPVVVSVDGPCKVFGSIHGQLWDLLSFFSAFGMPHMNHTLRGDLAYTQYVFLGDYGDRGKYSLEVILLLFSLKFIYPANITLLRGHHENRNINFHLGLRQECERRLPNSADATKVFDAINRTFEYLSLAALVNQEILCIHSGIQQSLSKIDQLKAFKKPISIPHPSELANASKNAAERFQEQLLFEMFTPAPFLNNGLLNEGSKYVSLAEQFCSANRLSLVIRSRFIPRRGASLVSSGKLFTVASACDLIRRNEAAMLHIVHDPPGTSIKARRLTTRSFSTENQKTFNVRQHMSGAEERWSHPRDVSPGRWIDDPQALVLTLADRLEWIVAADDVGPCHALDARNLVEVRRNRRLEFEATQKELLKEEQRLNKALAKREFGDALVDEATGKLLSGVEGKKSYRIRGSASSESSQPKMIPNPKSTRSRNAALEQISAARSKVLGFSTLDKELRDLGALPLDQLVDPENAPFLWRLWTQAGWTDKQWQRALAIFEQEYAEQLDTRQDIAGWTLETFSMWLLKCGRWLRECNLWFNAFDFDHDGVISPGDLLVGLLVTKARCTGPLAGLRLVGIMRLFMAEKEQPRVPHLSQIQFQSLVQEVSTRGVSIDPDELCPSAQFPIEYSIFATISHRLDLDSILRLCVEGIGP